MEKIFVEVEKNSTKCLEKNKKLIFLVLICDWRITKTYSDPYSSFSRIAISFDR
jgi:hypothetical protein